ncbi:MAG: protein kinase, partial [Planctomycetes bacterium]|nr:protein kinase [Planctomycetota bacterium]
MSGPKPSTRQAQEAYAEFRRRLAQGEDLSFDDFCAAHPELEKGLRVLHSLGEAEGSTAGEGSLEALLRQRFGPDGAVPETEAPGEPAGGFVPSSPGRRYTVRGELGRGGMGVVYRVWDEDLKRPLAMKVLDRGPGSASPVRSSRAVRQLLARFLHEARITGQLDHPGVVPVHELGIDAEGRVFFTMPLVEGRDLKAIFELAREGKEGWTLPRALGALARVCDTVAYAHRKGVIHRDLKPSNIMVGRFGEAYVMDWGLAKARGREAGRDLPLRPDDACAGLDPDPDRPGDAEDAEPPLVTLDGTVLGTPAYMPPEQAEGRIDEVDERSDVYALGAMLYTLLTGCVPYAGPGETPSPRETLAAVVRGPPRAVHSLERSAPPELVAICEKAMARSKEDRYPDAKALGEDLQAYLENRVVRAYRTGPGAEFMKWVARNRGMAASIAAAALAAIAGLLAVILVQEASRKELMLERDERGKALVQKTAALEEKESALAEKNQALGERSKALERAEGLRLVGVSSVVLPADPGLALLLAIEGAQREPGVLATNALLEALSTLRERRTLRGHADFISAVDFSADGRRVLTACRDTTLRIWDAESGGELLRLVGHERQINWGTFSPDGRKVASACWDTTARVWDAETGKEIARLEGHKDVVYFAAFSPDGAVVATTGHEGTARLWESETGKPFKTLRGHADSVVGAAFSPDGRRLATASRDGTLRLWEAATGASLAALTGHEGPVECVAFSPDGGFVVSGSEDGTARVWEAASGGAVAVLRAHRGSVRAVAFSPDGLKVATASSDETARLWGAAGGAETAVLRGHEDQLTAVHWSPDGRTLLTASRDRTARIWDAASGLEVAALRGHDGWVLAARFSPDGSKVVTGSNDRTARVWAASVDRELAALERPVWGGALAFSPDGKLVAVNTRAASAEVRDTATGELVAALEGHQGWIEAAAFSPDSGRIATASDDATGRVWEPAGGREIAVLRGHARRIDSVAFSADGSRVVTASRDFTARVWDAATGTQLNLLRNPVAWVHAAGFSPDGERVAMVADDGFARLFEAESGKEIRKLQHPAFVRAAIFDPAGRLLVTAADDNAVRVWDSLTGERLAVLTGQEGALDSAVFCAGGERLVTVHRDGTARV